jgi:hypothetical protein
LKPSSGYRMLLHHYSLSKNKNESSFVYFLTSGLQITTILEENTSNETLKSIKCYMNKQESLDPYQEDDRNTNQEDLEEDLEQ